MVRKLEFSKIYKCCNCNNELSEGGPIISYITEFNLEDQKSKSIRTELEEGTREKGFKAKITVLSKQKSRETNKLMEVTIYCRECGYICKY